MTDAISQVATEAIGVAASPVPIIAVLLVLLTAQARRNATAFAAAWMLSLAVVAIGAWAAGAAADGGDSTAASGGVSWPQVGLGALLLLLAANSWRSRPKPGEEPKLPAWMARIEGLTVPGAFGLGVLTVALNVKNLLLTVAAGSSLAEIDAPLAAEAVAIITFVVLASTTIVAPVLYFQARGARAEAQIDAARRWLERNNAVSMAVLLGAIGASLVAGGLA